MKEFIKTANAPSAIGPYNQAVKVGNTVYISGQIPLTPEMDLIEGSVQDEARQVFKNLQAICQAAGGDLKDIVKLTIFLVDMDDFAQVNEVMQEFCQEPYPARAAIGVKELPKGVQVEAEAIMVL
jgi:reactive intermediate/imine deaminase